MICRTAYGSVKIKSYNSYNITNYELQHFLVTEANLTLYRIQVMSVQGFFFKPSQLDYSTGLLPSIDQHVHVESHHL